MPTAGLIALLAILAGGLLILAVRVMLSYRKSPEKIERLRRVALNRRGRLADGVITGGDENAIFYTYTINGVIYNASQDIKQLYDRLPSDPERLFGPVWLKYAQSNPANSMIVCEEWSGITQILPTEHH